MRTGIYRVRKTWWGKCILQVQFDGPSFVSGQADSSIRVLYWADVDYNSAPVCLISKP